MTTWSYVHAFRAEHAEYLVGEGRSAPALSPENRQPAESDIAEAYAALGALAPSDLVTDFYRSDGLDELTVAIKGRADCVLRFLLALAKRCGQLYLFPFPADAMPGVVVDPADDLDNVLRRMDPVTRENVNAALSGGW